MKKFRNLLWVFNIAFLTLVMVITIVSVGSGIYYSVQYNRNIVPRGWGYDVEFSQVVAKFRYGAVQIMWVPEDYVSLFGRNVSEPKIVETIFNPQSQFGYPTEDYIESKGVSYRTGPTGQVYVSKIIDRRAFGFQYSEYWNGRVVGQTSNLTLTWKTVTFPYWPLLLVWMFFTFRSMKKKIVERVRGNRRRKGLCEHCVYDLRGTTGRCPECSKLATDVASFSLCQQLYLFSH